MDVDYGNFIASLSEKEKADLDMMIAPELAIRGQLSKIEQLRKWQPRDYQLPAWEYLANGGKRACLIWHRRSGKDDLALNRTCVAAHERVGEYWHMLPEAAQGRKAIWDAVNSHTGRKRIDQAFPIELRAKTRQQDMVVEFKNGSLWRVVGSDNYDSLLGSSPAGVVFSEWALADPNAWAFIRPILLENGGWAIFITTPRGPNHAKKTLELAESDPTWFAQVLSNDKTKVFSAADLANELREYQSTYGREEGAALVAQEYLCSFDAALVGSYYGSYLTAMTRTGRIGNVPVDRAVLVHTGWDLGYTDSTAIWFVQCVGKERRLIDYHEGSGVGLDEYARVLKDKAEKLGYVYGYHFFPHDLAFHEIGNKGLSREHSLRALGVTPKIVPNEGNVNDGINAVRRMLDMAWIDEKRCERGLDCLRNYRRQWNEKTKMFSDAPLHDWTSHGNDALRSFAMGFREAKEKPAPVPKIPSYSTSRRDRGTGWLRK